jgi:GNAT superfamily N-acetyltransferase
MAELEILPATQRDVPLILGFIRELAEYECLSHDVSAAEETLANSLFGERPAAEVLLGYVGGDPAGFALFFHSFSTFLGRPGIYLEDLYVRPEFRGRGWAARCWSTSRGSRRSATAGGSSGRFWIGTSPP